MELPGLKRLIEECRRLGLQTKTSPPGHAPPKAGTLIAGLPLDPLLAAVYEQLGHAAFATDVAGLILRRSDDREQKLEEDNQWWREAYRAQLAVPTLIFAGEPLLAYHYATVPSLANDQGLQPVVKVSVYEDLYALPVASSVDSFFDAYSRYLEALLALPEARKEGDTLLLFPRNVPHIIGRDRRLVELMRNGHFDRFMPDAEEQEWARKVIAAEPPHM